MSKHAAAPSAATRIREHQAWALAKIEQALPGFGKHRKES